ncbi:MAG: D-glycerate dehydrogenase [Chloroflexota bacterium]|nr:D-glycerate dehydrogenase [Chloroflexota bacterium]
MSRPVICVATPIEVEFLARLEALGDVRRVEPTVSDDELHEALADAHGVIMSPLRVAGAALFDAAPHLRVVAGTGVGYDNFDIPLATERGIAICNTPGVLNMAVTDLTMTLIVALARQLFAYEDYARSGRWAGRAPRLPLGHDIGGKVLGVVGFGRIGREVTRRMQSLGMRTLWTDVFDELPEGAPDSEYRPLDDLLRESDFVSLHTDLNPTSHGLIGARELALMRSDAYLVNTSRGPVVDQSALREALEAGSIAGAALDVLEDEPPDPADPIPQLPNVIVLPHIGTATEETRYLMRELAANNVIAVLTGETPPAIVNPEVLDSL